jgi:hypothetical protein
MVFKRCLISLIAVVCMVEAPVVVAETLTVTDPALSGWISKVLSKIPACKLNLVAQRPTPALRQAASLTNRSGMVCSRTQVS